jgi:hypothetical protein
MVLGSVVYVICGVAGAAAGGVEASIQGIAVAGWVGAAFFWLELRAELRNSGNIRLLPFGRSRQIGRHSKTSQLPEAASEEPQKLVAE